jgi:DNA repair exonuclease SbcCD nuclease subunit
MTRRTVRLAHVSDTHLGYRAPGRLDPESGRNQRAIDIELAYERIVSDILTREVDLVLHGGDVFHHTRPSWQALRVFVRQTRRLGEAGIPMLVIAGNHDTPRLRTTGTAFSLLELALPEVRFVTGYQLDVVPFEALELTVTAIPHGKLVDPLGVSAIPEAGHRNVLVTHGLVAGLPIAPRREAGEEQISDLLLAEEFDYIGLGHYHCFDRVRRNTWYSGSTERMGFGDETVTPGYAIVELGEGEPSVTHVPIAARPMVSLPEIDDSTLSARELADRVMEELGRRADPDGMARIRFRNIERGVRREAELLLRREAGELAWSLTFASANDLLGPSGEQLAEGVDADLPTLFARFVEGRNLDPEFKTAFLERGQAALAEAANEVEAASASEDAAA